MQTRCPYCKAEVLAGAAFCGACGSSLPTGAGASGQVESPSFFELPVSRRARLARIAIVLTMDAVLAGAGIAMMASYFGARAEASKPLVASAEGADAGAPKHQADVKVSPPRVVRPDGTTSKPPTHVEAPPVGTNGPKPPATGGAKPPGTGTTGTTGTPGTPGTKPPAGNEPPGNEDPGAVLGGISRRPDASVPSSTLPVPPVTPPPSPPTDTTPPPPASSPDAAPEAPPPPPETTDAEQTLATGVQRTVEGHMGQVRRCWENIAKSSSDSNLPEGTIEIQFAVQPSGSPAQVQVVQNQTGSPALGDCVVALVQSWRFPGHDGDPVVFVWPFFFQASK